MATMAQQKNCIDWANMLCRIADYDGRINDSTDDTGWTWVEVGHNASCVFYVGHDKDFDQFAVKCLGEGEEVDGIARIETLIYRHSATLADTVKGAYLGHD
jgi:hypothetical protein